MSIYRACPSCGATWFVVERRVQIDDDKSLPVAPGAEPIALASLIVVRCAECDADLAAHA